MSVCADSLPTSTHRVQSDAGAIFGFAQRGDEDYFMKCTSRGWAYILNMAGQAEDATLLEKTLSHLHFDVLVINQNQVPDAMTARNIIQRTPKLFKKTEDCIFIAVLFTTSQNQKSILENAWKVIVEDCDFLVTKPKILLLQEYNDPEPEESNIKSDHTKVVSDSSSRLIPTHCDVLLVHGFGPCYIKCFCEVLAENNDDVDDVLSMLAQVHYKVAVANKQNIKTNSQQSNLPFYSSMLIHKLKFIKKKSVIKASEDELAKRRIYLTEINISQKPEELNDPGDLELLASFKNLLKKRKLNQITDEESCDLKRLEELLLKLKKQDINYKC